MLLFPGYVTQKNRSERKRIACPWLGKLEYNRGTPKKEENKIVVEELGAKWLLRFLFLSFFYALVHSLEERKKNPIIKDYLCAIFSTFFYVAFTSIFHTRALRSRSFFLFYN